MKSSPKCETHPSGDRSSNRGIRCLDDFNPSSLAIISQSWLRRSLNRSCIWIKEHLAEEGDEVHGMIIAREGDDGLRYAVGPVPNLTFQVYEVEFRLKAPSALATHDRGT
jgi:hypothetical protein